MLKCVRVGLLVLLMACTRNAPEVVASGTGWQITLDEFRRGYLTAMKAPTARDSPAAREAFLRELVERRLLAENGRKQGLDTLEAFRYRVAAYRAKILREAHYDAVIAPQVEIGEAELRRTYGYMRQPREIRHLFAPDSAAAAGYAQQLGAGVAFDILAAQCFGNTPGVPITGELGWVNWDQLDYGLADVAWSLRIGEYSAPTASSYGWHILQVTDFKADPLIREADFEQARQGTRTLLAQKRGEGLASAYIVQIMAQQQIQVDGELAAHLADKLKGQFHREPSNLDAAQPTQLSELELQQLETSLWDHRHQTLALINGEPLSVSRFLYDLQYVPYYASYRSFREAFNFVLRDEVLTRDALIRGLDEQPQIREQTGLFEDFVLASQYKRTLIRALRISPAELQTRYAELGQKWPPEDQQEAARLEQIMTREKQRQSVQNTVDSMWQASQVNLNIDPIHSVVEAILTPT